MLDIRLIRENPEKINELLKRRNPELSIDKVLEIDADRRKIQAEADELRSKRKNESQKIGMMKKNGENTDAIQEEVRALGDEVKALEEMKEKLTVALARGSCKNVTRQEVHELVDEIFDEYI